MIDPFGQDSQPEPRTMSQDEADWQNFLLTGKRPSLRDFVIVTGTGC